MKIFHRWCFHRNEWCINIWSAIKKKVKPVHSKYWQHHCNVCINVLYHWILSKAFIQRLFADHRLFFSIQSEICEYDCRFHFGSKLNATIWTLDFSNSIANHPLSRVLLSRIKSYYPWIIANAGIYYCNQFAFVINGSFWALVQFHHLHSLFYPSSCKQFSIQFQITALS